MIVVFIIQFPYLQLLLSNYQINTLTSNLNIYQKHLSITLSSSLVTIYIKNGSFIIIYYLKLPYLIQIYNCMPLLIGL